MPIKARKVVSQGKPIGGLIRADFEAGESFSLNGYWMHPTRQANVEVPIFQHEFYPKLDHTDLDIKQNVSYRTVVVPSIAELHQAGIEADKAIFVAEVVIHPRYIKNSNFFRGEFPASVKTLAKQNGIVFVFPACDMPFARLKRKQVLNYYRASFSPLYIKGRHYTSGRMSFFFVAPLHATLSLRKTLNLENVKEKEATLTEAFVSPAFERIRQKRKADKEISAQVQKEIHDLVLPLVSSKFDIPLNSPKGVQLTKVMDDPHLAQDFVDATYTQPKPRRFDAVKNWVTYSFWPRLKDTVASETSQAFDEATRYAIRLALSIAFDRTLDHLKNLPEPTPGTSARRPSPWRSSVKNTAKKFNYNFAGNAGTVGYGTINYTSGREDKATQMAQRDRIHALKGYATELLFDVQSLRPLLDKVGSTGIAQLLKIIITGDNRVIVSIDEEFIEHLRRTNALADIGPFEDPANLARIKNYFYLIGNQLTQIYREMRES